MRAREILARLRELRSEEDRLQIELFELTESEGLLSDANAWYSQTQIDEMEGKN